MILVLATLSHELGVSFSRLRPRSAGKLLEPVAGRPSMFVLRSMRKPPQRFLADVSVNHSRTGAVKLLITRRDEPSRLSSSGVPFAGLQPVPGGPQLGCDPAPRSKRMTRPCASRTLLSSCLRGQCRLTLWGTLDARGRADVAPPRAFSSIAAMYPVLASATAPAH